MLIYYPGYDTLTVYSVVVLRVESEAVDGPREADRLRD